MTQKMTPEPILAWHFAAEDKRLRHDDSDAPDPLDME